MKTLLQLDIDSNFDKSMYSISKTSFKALTQPPKDYRFDCICYKVHDINVTILHDIVLQISEAEKEKFNQFTIFLDRCSQENYVKLLIDAIENLQLFKRQKVEIGHFSIFNDCLYDYNKKKWNFEHQSSSLSERKQEKVNVSPEELQSTSRELTLCEDIKMQQIHLIPETIKYNDIKTREDDHNFFSNSIKAHSQMAKKFKQLESKKVIEFYIMKMGTKCKINIINLNYNKSYSLTLTQKKQLSDLLMLYGADVGEIKYKTVNVELINIFLKKASEVFFVAYFPMPLNETVIVKNIEKEKKHIQSKFQQNKCLSLEKYCGQAFLNFSYLSSKSKEKHEKIIITYLEEKEQILKLELDKMSERLKELKVIHRVEEEQIADINFKSRKSFERLIDNINYLRSKGIKNVRKHIDWLNTIAEEKKTIIKEEEEEIDRINKRIIESRRNHDYFIGKMELFRQKLKKNYEDILKRKWQTWKVVQSKSDGKENNSCEKKQLKLSPAQKQELDVYKQKLKQELKERLKNCKERQLFYEHLNQLKKRANKLELSKYEQRYIDLLHE